MSYNKTAIRSTIIIFIAAAFVIYSITNIINTAIYIPRWDHWGWYYNYLTKHPDLFTTLLAPHNNHLLVIPSLFYAIDFHLFSASHKFLIATNIISLIFTGLILIWQITNWTIINYAHKATLAAIAFALPFWWYNWTNLLCPFQTTFILTYLFIVTGLYLNSLIVQSNGAMAGDAKRYELLYALILLLGVFATLSSGSGLAFWPTAIFTMALFKADKKLIYATIIVGLIAMIAFVSLTHVNTESISNDHYSLLRFVNYFILALGSPAIYGGSYRTTIADISQLYPAYVLGSIGTLWLLIILYKYCIHSYKAYSKSEVFFVSLLVWSLLSIFMVMIARHNHPQGATQALASRYALFTIPFWTSLLVISAPIAWNRTHGNLQSTIKLGFNLALLCIPLWLGYTQIDYMEWWKSLRNKHEMAKLSLMAGTPDHEMLGYIYPPGQTQLVVEISRIFRKKMVSFFRTDSSILLGRPAGSLIAGTPVPECKGSFDRIAVESGLTKAYGWVIFSHSIDDKGTIYIVDDEGMIVGIGAQKWWKRLDVQKAFQLGSDAYPGWHGYINLSLTNSAPENLRAFAALGGTSFCSLGSPHRIGSSES